MARGIIYVMTTVVDGLIKIGKTGSDAFESRMYQLERNGYCNVVGLKRRFAIEVEDYDEKEKLIDEIFSKSRVFNSELFSLDAELVVQLLSSFEGKKIYPKDSTKEEAFLEASKECQDKIDRKKIPEGDYSMEITAKGRGKVTATMTVKDGAFIVRKGSGCLEDRKDNIPEICKNLPAQNGVLVEDVATGSPSTAGSVVIGYLVNGWKLWKDKNGNPIEIYKKNQ